MMDCIRCGCVLPPALPGDHGNMTASGGVLFRGAGNYGSTVFDPIDGGGNLVIAVCDACLLARQMAVVHERFGTVSNEFGSYEAVIARGPWEPTR